MKTDACLVIMLVSSEAMKRIIKEKETYRDDPGRNYYVWIASQVDYHQLGRLRQLSVVSYLI
jgi:hypothetical protein